MTDRKFWKKLDEVSRQEMTMIYYKKGQNQMKTIQEIYKDFDTIGCLTFATVTAEGYPETRIAHLFAWDKEGLYFLTMNHKPFAKQLRESGKLSICGMNSRTQAELDERMLPSFEAGYTMKATGDVREVSLTEIREKAKNNSLFLTGINDWDRYQDEIFFCLYRFWGERYDFDYDLEEMIEVIENDCIDKANFELTFYGPAQNPSVMVGDHVYELLTELEEGEYATVNSLTKKILQYDMYGNVENIFHLRSRDSYIFEKIPEGTTTISRDKNLKVDITLFDERGEPEWI